MTEQWYDFDEYEYRPRPGDCAACGLQPAHGRPGLHVHFRGAHDPDTGETYDDVRRCGKGGRCPAVIAAAHDGDEAARRLVAEEKASDPAQSAKTSALLKRWRKKRRARTGMA